MHDVVVIGAGPGGSAAAYFLARQDLDVLLLDKATFPRDKTCGDGLTPRALRVLDELGALDEVNRLGNRLEEATVYAPAGTHVTTRVPVRDGLPPYLLTLPRMTLDHIILERAINANAQFKGDVKVAGIEPHGEGVSVTGTWQNTRFVAKGRVAIIAVGANVRLLRTIGFLDGTPNMILAARTYLDDLQFLENRFEFHFDGVPLPGYGWIFPLSPTSANVGAGIWPRRRRPAGMPSTAAAALKGFLQLPKIQEMGNTVRQLGPVKGFPLRTDFATAATYGERTLLVGESAGLVNPLTGEGIDLALESAKIAADHLLEAFDAGDLSQESLVGYDRKLRDRFQRLFVSAGRIRDWYLNERVLNRLVYAADRSPTLKMTFTDIVLGNIDAAEGLSFRTILRILFAH